MAVVGSFDSIVLAAVAGDLQALRGSRVQRIAQPGQHEITLALRGPARPAVVVCSIHPRWARIHLGPAAGAVALSPFAQMLRSRLDGARLLTVEQPPFERTITLRFGTDTGEADLVAEIMGRHSNLILVQHGVIAGALKPVPRAKSVREVLPGVQYAAPPHPRPTPLELTPQRLEELVGESAEPLVQTLSTRLLGLSPTMAAEVAWRAGCDPQAPPGRGREVLDRLWASLRELIDVVEQKTFAPVVYVDGGDAVGYAPFPLHHVTALRPVAVATMSEAVARVMSRAGAQAELAERRAAVVSAVRAALARAGRAEADLRAGLEEATHSEGMRQRGELLLAYASQIPVGATEATLPGYDGTPLRIALDPTLSAIGNARKIFTRYTKIRRARPALEDRLRRAMDARSYLESALTMAEQAASVDDLEAMRRELAEEGYLRRKASHSRRAPAAPPRTYTLDGATVLVGRTNQDNDRITFKVAAPDDLWFHARGVPGAHVILRTGGRQPTPREIARAASIAAWFSQAREAGSVPVDYTARRHVRKPKGSRPGAVVYTRERTVRVPPQGP